MRVLVELALRNARQIDLAVPVAIPVRLRDHVGIVRLGHRHHEAERTPVLVTRDIEQLLARGKHDLIVEVGLVGARARPRSEEHTSELQSPCNLVCRLLLEKKKKKNTAITMHNTKYRTTIAATHSDDTRTGIA